jgi:hypothetical protein
LYSLLKKQNSNQKHKNQMWRKKNNLQGMFWKFARAIRKKEIINKCFFSIQGKKKWSLAQNQRRDRYTRHTIIFRAPRFTKHGPERRCLLAEQAHTRRLNVAGSSTRWRVQTGTNKFLKNNI